MYFLFVPNKISRGGGARGTAGWPGDPRESLKKKHFASNKTAGRHSTKNSAGGRPWGDLGLSDPPHALPPVLVAASSCQAAGSGYGQFFHQVPRTSLHVLGSTCQAPGGRHEVREHNASLGTLRQSGQTGQTGRNARLELMSFPRPRPPPVKWTNPALSPPCA